MKKSICFVLLAFCTVTAFSQTAVTSASESGVPEYGFFGLGGSVSFFQQPDYQSEVFAGLSCYVDPVFSFGTQLPLGQKLSVNFDFNYNLMALGKSVVFMGDWIKGCNHWAGSGTLLLNHLLIGMPYVIGLAPAVFYAMCGFDSSVFLYWHPFCNNWLDTKLGAGLSNEPSNQYDEWKASYFIQPFFSLRAQADFSTGMLMGSVFCSCSYDLRKPLDCIFDIRGTHDEYLNKITVGIQLGLKTTK